MNKTETFACVTYSLVKKAFDNCNFELALFIAMKNRSDTAMKNCTHDRKVDKISIKSVRLM
jgi:hypothetical protein